MAPGLTFNIFGNDVSASSALRGVEGQADRSSQSIGGKFKSMAGTIGKAFAAVGAVDFLKGSFDEAEEAQKVGAQTAAVIKSTGAAAGVTADQVSDLAGSISEKAGIDDEAIQSGQNLLLTFTDIRNEAGRGNDIFDQTTKIMADMSVATGQSMTGAATMLGKALNDPVAGLSKLSKIGVVFTAEQKEQVKALAATGDKMGAQRVILAELNKEFGGSAAAQATSADKMKVAWGNLQEQVGTALMPIFTAVADTLTNDVLPAVSGVTDWLQKNWSWLKYVAGAAVGLWAAMKGWTVLRAVGDALQALPAKAAAARGALLATGDAMAAGKAKAGGFFATYGKGIGVFGAVAAAAILGGKAIADAVDENSNTVWALGNVKNSVGSLTTALTNSKGQTEAATRAWAQAQIEQGGLADGAAQAGITIDELTAALAAGGPAASKLAAEMSKAGGESAHDADRLRLLAFNRDAVTKAYEGSTVATKNNAAATRENAKAQEGNTDALGRTTDELKAQEDAAKKLLQAWDDLSGDRISAAQAELRFKDGMAEATQQVKENGRSLSENTSKGRANREWLLDQISSLRGIASAQLDAGESTDSVTTKMEANKAALERAAIAAGLSKSQVHAMIAEFAKVPPRTPANVATNAGAATGKVKGLNNEIAKVKPVIPFQIDVRVDRRQFDAYVSDLATVGSSAQLDYAAKSRSFHGGRNAQGTGYWRGGFTSLSEMGDEQVYLPRGARVDTADTTLSRARMAGGGNGLTVEIHNHGVMATERDVQRFVTSALEQALNTGESITAPARSLQLR